MIDTIPEQTMSGFPVANRKYLKEILDEIQQENAEKLIAEQHNADQPDNAEQHELVIWSNLENLHFKWFR